LVFATGPGAIGNRTIGTAAAGGMLFGTIFGVLIVPGLYFIFASISAKHNFVEGEEDEPLTDEMI
jgi:HAE1 family hydrophobic/amphiphilic exporter-1